MSSICWLASIAIVATAACGASGDDTYLGGLGNGGAGSIAVGSLGGGGSSSAANSVGGTSSGITGCGNVDYQGCVGTSYEGESLPFDIYIMFDQSGSMNTDVGGLTRLQAVQRAAAAFLNDPKSLTIGVGIGYFGFLPVQQVSCDPNTYAQADVAMTFDHSRVISSLNARKPTGETPTAAAIRGACGYTKSWRSQNTGHKIVILLVTDGIPEAPASCASGGCCPTLNDAVQAASDCSSGSSGVPIYVLGVGPQLDNLNQIAVAGGTKAAYLVGNQDVTANVLGALNAIRGAAIPCDLEIPAPSSGQTLDYTRVNVAYSPGGCNFRTVFHVASASECDPSRDGWYYDNPSAPTTVKLCGSTCAQVSQPEAKLGFYLGCQSVDLPPR
ncbi:MAG: vWA domain-containing protein [Polyangiaceae bacterium]